MAIETHQSRGEPWELWTTIDYANNGDMRALHAIRARNTSAVDIRITFTQGRGSSTIQKSEIVRPGEDRTYPDTAEESVGFPVSLRGSEWGIGIEQV